MKNICQICGQVFPDLLDGCQNTPLHKRIAAQIAASPKCTACFESYRKTVALCRKTLAKTDKPGASDKLIDFLREKILPTTKPSHK